MLDQMEKRTRVGAVLALDDPPFWAVIDGDGEVIAAVSDFMLDFWARGNAESSCRSYAYGLLRWFRHLALERENWERAARETVRDFVLACRQPSALSARPLSPRTLNHNLAVISAFYDYQLAQQRGPIINPVPARRAQSGQRLNAHHNPELAFRRDRRADFRQKVPKTAPRLIVESRVAEILQTINNARDRALVEFYLSSAARPSELLGMTLEDVDPGSQRITVERKGSRAKQALPASSNAFLWLRLYQESLPPDLLAKGNPVWWTNRRPYRPFGYDAARAMFNRVGLEIDAKLRLHGLRHTAAVRMSNDPALTLSDIQRILGHLHLSTTQEYLQQHDDDIIERVAQHLLARSEPKPTPEAPGLTYDSSDLDELLGDASW